ncbi:uncharacterized protein EV422DRAFT_331398 [Fimicolochytrium jonesii]|uniref:uncharacterized protein n=1 Tax=Fimicolochytrium jonesii TaxID=1396493 RepID=UPI0022FEB6F4|nr:uncharacterized protein EV422DRAFT_331398 [Fimicolochytrium jonesii]KAI8816053.1 hypothetical protein EV422DRAFT_331398 [Fimicolochytrium jonesii]
MGGNALKTCVTRRLPIGDYRALIARLTPYVSMLYERTAVPHSVYDKQDFGDLDILVAGPKVNDPAGRVADHFRSKERTRAGPVTSLEVDEFQVDLISVPLAAFDYAFAFYNWNGFGMLRGVLARSLGLKDGAEGLRAPVYYSPVDDAKDYARMMADVRAGTMNPSAVEDYDADSSAVMGFVVLSLDHEQVLRFLGLDVEACRKGFRTVEELCAYFAATKYFMPAAFSKHCERRRPIMLRFGEFLHKTALPAGSAAFSEVNDIRRAERALFRKMAVRHFGKTAQWNALVEKERIRRRYKASFGADIVRGITAMEGKELGEVMKMIKAKVPMDAPDIPRMLDALDEDAARVIIEECWRSFTPEAQQSQ